MDVYFYEAFEEEAGYLKKCLADSGLELEAGFTWKTIQEDDYTEPPAPIISIRTQSQIPPCWANGINAVLTRSTGYDHLRKYISDTCSEFQAGYLPLYCSRAVAEHAIMTLFALMRKLVVQRRQFVKFHRDGITGFEIQSKRLLIVGVGNIGYEALKIGRGLEMQVKGVDVDQKHSDVEYVDIEKGLAWADAVICCMNLTEDNRGYFDVDKFSMMQRKPFFVNVARGELASGPEVLKALKAGRIAGASMDVYSDESSLAAVLRDAKPTGDNPDVWSVVEMLERDDVLLTPHNAFNTQESVMRKSAQSIEQLRHLKSQGCFKWPLPQSG
jgi:D-lactate dehydrogenase